MAMLILQVDLSYFPKDMKVEQWLAAKLHLIFLFSPFEGCFATRRTNTLYFLMTAQATPPLLFDNLRLPSSSSPNLSSLILPSELALFTLAKVRAS